MNTNADALSRIEINSKMLKQMLPIEKEIKINVITRSKTKNEAKENDQLLVWQCTSLTEIKNIKKMKFEFINELKAMPKIRINARSGEIMVPIKNKKELNLKESLEKLLSKTMKLKIDKFAIAENDVIFEK